MPTNDPDPDIFTLVELPGDLIRETEPGLEKKLNGGFADVIRGRWTPPGGTTCPVAIKYLRTIGTQSSSTQREKVARVNKVRRGFHSLFFKTSSSQSSYSSALIGR